MLRLAAATACLLALALSGCSSSSDGTASAYVKDAPNDTWSAVHLTFTQVSVHQSGGNSTGWTTLFSDSAGTTVDLLAANGTNAAFLGASGLAAGHYQQVRIVVTKAHGVLKNGTGVDIGLPQSGDLKLSKSFKVEAGKETQVVIDFDLGKALTQKNGAWEFKPVVGKVYTHIKEKGSSPARGTVETVDLDDDASE